MCRDCWMRLRMNQAARSTEERIRAVCALEHFPEYREPDEVENAIFLDRKWRLHPRIRSIPFRKIL